MSKILLEVCVEGVNNLVVAQENGADRVELCASVAEGGVTPSVGCVQAALDVATIPFTVIVRPRGGDFVYSDLEFDSMCRDITALRELGVAGVVSGCLRTDGDVDLERVKEMVRRCGPMSFTFHRAFDMVRDTDKALEDLIAGGVTRVLTSGQSRNAEEGLEALERLGKRAGERITIMPCGSIRAHNIARIHDATRLREYHFAAHGSAASTMVYRNADVRMGAASNEQEYLRTVTDPVMVRETIEAGRAAARGD